MLVRKICPLLFSRPTNSLQSNDAAKAQDHQTHRTASIPESPPPSIHTHPPTPQKVKNITPRPASIDKQKES
jgi:hypothetical protein